MPAPLVVLVDDDAQALILVRRAIGHQMPEARLVEAKSARELDDLLASRQPDVILLDFNLPDRDGLMILRDVKKRGFDGGIVFITGVGSERIAVEAMKRGATDYIVKSTGYELQTPRAIRKAYERVLLEREVAQAAAARKRGEATTPMAPAALLARLEEPIAHSLEELDVLEQEVAALTADPHALAAGRSRAELCIASLKNDLERLRQIGLKLGAA